ncbi:MAG: hypothetical protein ACLQU3_05930 [Limisphaerales bacterium]
MAESEHRRLSGDPNVLAVGYGVRVRGGKPVMEACVQYHVRKKLASAAEARKLGTKWIAQKAGGYPTDVIESKTFRPAKNDGPPTGSRGSQIENPLIGGTSTTVLSDWYSFPTGFGTLGGICFDNITNDAMAISNAHVWGQEVGAECIQPWMPTGEYVGASLELLTCGPAAFIVNGTVPSPLTAGLAAAAAAVWVAAAASDAEDPSRWGQRTGAVPAAGVLTTGETIRIEAPLAPAPYAGRAYSTEAKWDYVRHTSAGDITAATTADRPNEHTLVGKLVWTDRDQYQLGNHVSICAEVISRTIADPAEFFVVAVCYPINDPERVLYRVLTPGNCSMDRKASPVCIADFPDPPPSMGGSGYSINLDPYRFESSEPLRVVKGPAGTALANKNLLKLPSTPVRILIPPCTLASIEVILPKGPMTVIGRNSAGLKVASARLQAGAAHPQKVTLEAAEMVEVVLTTRDHNAQLVGIGATKNPHPVAVDAKSDDLHYLLYRGGLDLNLTEQKGPWNIILQVQGVDPSSPGGDPIAAARTLGGMTASGNISVISCIAIALIDAAFLVL